MCHLMIGDFLEPSTGVIRKTSRLEGCLVKLFQSSLVESVLKMLKSKGVVEYDGV